MKKHQKAALMAALMLASADTLALPKRGSSSGRAASASGRPAGGGTPGTAIGGGGGAECRPNATQLDGSHTISYDYLLSATDGAFAESQAVRVEEIRPGQYTVKMEAFINACLKPRFEFSQVGGQVFISAYNDHEALKKEEWAEKNNDDKYTECLKDNGLLNAQGAIDWDKANQQGQVSNSYTSPGFSIDQGQINKNTTVKLYFASAQLGSRPPGPAEPPNATDSQLECRWYEDFGRHYIEGSDPLKTQGYELQVGERDQIYRDFQSICRSGDAGDLWTFLYNLRSLGNYADLEDAIEEAILLQQEQASENYMRQMISIIEGIGEEGELTDGQLNRFRHLARQMQSEVLDPLGTQLENLRQRYDSADTLEEKEKLEEKIDKLTDLVERSGIALDTLRPIYGVIRNRESKHPIALDVERMRGKAILYKRIDPRTGRSITLEDANKKIEREVNNFRTAELEDWRCHAQSHRGNPACLRAATQDIQSRQASYARARRQFQSRQLRCQHYMHQARTQGINFFGASPVYEDRKCRRNMKKDMARIQSMGRSTLRYMQRRGEQKSRYQAGYQSYLEYRAQQRRERQNQDDFGSFRLGSLDYSLMDGGPGGYASDMYSLNATPSPYQFNPSMQQMGMPHPSPFAPMPSPMAGPMMHPHSPSPPPMWQQYGGRP